MRSQVLIALGCAVCLGLGAWLALRLRALRERMRGRALQRQGARGERDAERLLKVAGYTIVDRQVRRSYAMEVAGELRDVEVSFDFVVARDGEQLVAEVKTGVSAPRLERAETRRQLLEYQLVTGARCVLLVDPDAAVITEVAFPISVPKPASSGAWGLGAACVAAMAALALAWYLQHTP